MMTLAPLVALKKVTEALGFEIRDGKFVHVDTGFTLKVVWSTAAAEGLRASHGIDAEQELAKLVLDEVWACVTSYDLSRQIAARK